MMHLITKGQKVHLYLCRHWTFQRGLFHAKIVVMQADALVAATTSVVIIGNFDGVHRGHQSLLALGLRWKRELRAQQLRVLTFAPHPQSFFSQKPEQRLLPTSASHQRMRAFGVDSIHVQKFDKDFSSLGPIAFIDQFLLPTFAPSMVIVGEDFRFGQNRSGSAVDLKNWLSERGVKSALRASLLWKEERISTGRIKSLVLKGEMANIPNLLGMPFFSEGIVESGAGLGRKLGFPTANLGIKEGLVPGSGIYATRTLVRGREYPSVTHIGPAPTMGREAHSVETFILQEVDDSLYGESMRIEYFQRLRAPERFDSIELLKRQIERDVEEATRIAKQLGYWMERDEA